MVGRKPKNATRRLHWLLVKANAAAGPVKSNQDDDAAWSDAAKAMSRKLRPTDSAYRLGFSR